MEQNEILRYLFNIGQKKQAFNKKSKKVQTSLAWKPPEPPPLPPQPIYIENANPCYFRDGIRKIDYILVYSKDKLIRDDVGNEKIRSFVTALEDAGLEMEGEDGYVMNAVFVFINFKRVFIV